MTSSFQSIFSQNTDVDPGLSKLFNRKVKPKKPVEAAVEATPVEAPKKLNKLDPETEKRTLFVGNLHADCKKEELIKMFKSYGKIETVRFRNIVPEDITKPKKYAFITKQLHPNKVTINAFVRFKDEESATNAAKEVNGMEYKNLHLRVDIASRSKNHNNKACIFLGGLAFDITDEAVYTHFAGCGEIDYVRIIRDNKTGVGKGFGYVQFKTADSLALALKLDASKINERKIRVTRWIKKQKVKNEEPKDDRRPANRSSNQRDKSKPEKSPKMNKKAKKRLEALEQTNQSADSAPKKKFNTKNKKLFKKKHIATNNKNASRFQI